MNVLILTDFSEASENAGRYALDFLKETPSTISLLNIQDIDFKQTAGEQLQRQMMSISGNLHTGIEKLQAYNSNPEHKFHISLSLDNLITAVRSCVTEKHIDLIFIGAASQAEHQHPLLGNHAYEVIRKIKCKIIAVPGNTKFVIPKRMILPIDYSVLSKSSSFQVLIDKNYVKSKHLTVLNVNETKNISENEDFLKDTWNGNSEDHLEILALSKRRLFNKDFMLEIQDKFDVIAILGKNLSICDQLLHSSYGLCSEISNKLPILVLHD